MKLTQIDLAEGRGGSQREVSASEAVARAEEACGGTLLLFEPDGVPRAAVAICPGGGFGKVNTEHEGVAFAEWFVAHGIAAGVVKYRLPEGDPALPQQDVERAAELLHNRFDGVKTGVLGASIGGYLAAGAGAALHLYPSGGHGFGLRREFAWREALVGELRMWLDATIGTV